MNEVSGAIEREAILTEGPSEAADGLFLLKHNRIVFAQVITGAQAGQTATDDYDLLHEVISTFIRRYAERHANDNVPVIVAAAHSRVTWLMSRAVPARTAPAI